MSMRSQTSKAI